MSRHPIYVMGRGKTENCDEADNEKDCIPDRENFEEHPDDHPRRNIKYPSKNGDMGP